MRTYGEMDITAVFGTVILGSNPGRCTTTQYRELLLDIVHCAGRRHVRRTVEAGSRHVPLGT